MSPLYLTAQEQVLYAKLPEALREGWEVETEVLHPFERPEDLHMRFHIARFTDANLQLLAKNGALKTPADIEKILRTFNIATLSREQMAELFFVLGLRVVSAMIVGLLTEAKDDEDMDGIAAISTMRHLLDEANSSVTV